MANESTPGANLSTPVSSPSINSVPTPAEAANMVADAIATDKAPEAAPKAPEAPKAPPAPKTKKYKLKVDGKEYDEEVNLDDDEYVTRQLQLAKASQKRMNEFASLQKEVLSFIEQLRKDPKKTLSDPKIGIDIKQLAAQVIEDEIANSKKSPEQLEKEQLQQQLKDIQAEREKEKEDGRQKEFDRVQQQEYERYDLLMSKAIESSDLPKSPYIIKKMADYMLMGIKEGLDVTPEDVLPLVRQEMQSDLKEMFAVMPEEVIESIVGKDVINRIRKKSVAKAKSAPQTPNKNIQDTGTAKKTEVKSDKEKLNFKQFFGV